MYKLDEHVACAVAGITSDANILINTARVTAQRHTFTYAEPMPVEQLVQSLCDTKQARTCGVCYTRGLAQARVFSCAGVHTVWRPAPLWRLLPLRRLGRGARLPAVPERPQRQLRRLEGDRHRHAPGSLLATLCALASDAALHPPQARTAALRRAS